MQLSTFAAVEALAAEQHLAVGTVLDDAVMCGLDVLRQRMFFEEHLRRARASGVTAEEAIAILHRAGKGNAPEPGDELPEGYQRIR